MSTEQEHSRSEETTERSTDGHIDLTKAFQSPEFVTGLQTAMAQTFQKFSTPPTSVSSQVSHLEQLGEPSHYTEKSSTSTGQPSALNATRRPVGPLGTQSGMLLAPTFVSVIDDNLAPDGVNARPERCLEPRMIQNNPNPGSSSNDNITLCGSGNTQHHTNRPTHGSAQPFILGPGRAPIPVKLVTQIVSHRYIDLAELSPDNLEEGKSEVTSFTIEGSTILPCSKNTPGKDRMRWTSSPGWNVLTAMPLSSVHFSHTERVIYLLIWR